MEKLPLCKRPWASSLNFEFDVGGQVQFPQLRVLALFPFDLHSCCGRVPGQWDHHGRQDGGV